MTIMFGPEGIIKDEEIVVQHDWEDFMDRCKKCGIRYKDYQEIGTPCTIDVMPE